jgi:hypothetical protein
MLAPDDANNGAGKLRNVTTILPVVTFIYRPVNKMKSLASENVSSFRAAFAVGERDVGDVAPIDVGSGNDDAAATAAASGNVDDEPPECAAGLTPKSITCVDDGDNSKSLYSRSRSVAGMDKNGNDVALVDDGGAGVELAEEVPAAPTIGDDEKN